MPHAARPALPTSAGLSRRGFLGLGAGLGAAALLTACGGDDGGTAKVATGASSAAALEPYTVRTCVYAKNHASSALYWQKFAPKGITVQVTPVTSAPSSTRGAAFGGLRRPLAARADPRRKTGRPMRAPRYPCS